MNCDDYYRNLYETMQFLAVESHYFLKRTNMLYELERFADKDYAKHLLYELKWPGGKIICSRCDGSKIREFVHPSMPFWCADCQEFFSIKHGTLMQNSRLPIHNWTIAAAYDLNSLTGISATNLGKVTGITRKSTRTLLNQIRSVFTLVHPPKEFESGQLFRFDEVPYIVKESSRQGMLSDSDNAVNSNRFVVICITESKSNKFWVEVVPAKRPDIVNRIVEKVIPRDAHIFASQGMNFGDLNQEKYTLRNDKDEFGEYSTAWARYMGKNIENYTKIASSELENGFTEVYHQMTFDQLDLYVKTFAGRWNIQDWDLEKRIRYIFSRDTE